ncbi:MAG: hypothetical protein KatS3mg115_2407 [Candidatus Poribacteria bacterium]|nr:MAG: hypothetical protein KatS3mg115_2407 [Candidatus Poribacteria bacterium]
MSRVTLFSLLAATVLMGWSLQVQADWTVLRPDDFQRNDGVEGELKSISFADDLHGWAVGDNGLILHTVDGGKTWELQKLPEPPRGQGRGGFFGGGTPQLWRVRALSPQKAWVVGSGGLAAYTTDGGQTWMRVNSQASGSRLVDVLFVNEQLGFLTGDNSHIIKTTDGGQTWVAVSSGRRARAGDNRTIVEGIAFATETIGWAVGSTGTVVVTRDAGDNWDPPENEVPATENLYGITFVSPQEGWIVGQEGVILHTTDGGNHWERVPNPAEEEFFDLYDVAFVPGDPTRGWISGDGGMLLETQNGGAAWARVETGIHDVLNGVAATPSGRAYACGGWGIILWNGIVE